MGDCNIGFACGAYIGAHTSSLDLFRTIQEAIPLAFGSQHSLDFFNEHPLTGTGVLDKGLTLLGRALQCRLKNFPNAAKVFRRYRLSVEKITHSFDRCALRA